MRCIGILLLVFAGSLQAQEPLSDGALLDLIQERAFGYFWNEANPENGLIRDRNTATSPSSIAAVGFGLSALTVGIDHGWITREQGRERVLTTLEFFWTAPQSEEPDATGYRGFFYHFLDMDTGRRAWNSELSTIDTALLLGGVLHTRMYFDEDDPSETRIRALADSINNRVEWDWAQVRPPRVSHGWRPESGFLNFDWGGYNEAMIVYLLALGSPTHPVGPEAWTGPGSWTSSYRWETHYGFSFVVFPPLFGHQYTHVWVDFRGLQDAYMRGKGIDYFENSRRATLAQREYAIDNPGGWSLYGENAWGFTASDVPDGYRARGAPPAFNDDGTITPTAPGGSYPFTPDESLAVLRYLYETFQGGLWGKYGFRDAFNPTTGWFARDVLGIDQGPILLMIENGRTGRVWDVAMQHEVLQRGLERAGFTETPVPLEQDRAPVFRVDPLFPNPARRQVHLRYTLPRPETVTVDLYDALGRRVQRHTSALQSTTLTLDTSALPKGVYFCTLKTAAATVTQSFIQIR